MKFDWSGGGLAEGLRCYRNQQFFEAHEHWEGVWLQAEEPAKTFLQALIQVTVAFHHLGRGNTAGALSLMTRAVGRLENFPPEYGGVDVEMLRTSLRAWLDTSGQPDRPPSLTPPKIADQ